MKLVDAQLIQSDPRLLSGVNATNKQNRDNKGHGVNSSPKLIPPFLFFLLYVICLLGAASGLGGGVGQSRGSQGPTRDQQFVCEHGPCRTRRSRVALSRVGNLNPALNKGSF